MHGVQEVERGEAVVTDHHDPALRQPAGELEQHLPGPVGELLVAEATRGSITLGGTEDGELDLPRKSGEPFMKQEDFHGQTAETFYTGFSG